MRATDATLDPAGGRVPADGRRPHPSPPPPTLDNNLKQIALGFHNHHDATGAMTTAVADKDGKPLLSWRVALLPYVEQERLYQQFKLDEPWDSTHNKKVLADNPMPAIYAFPVGPKPADKDAKKDDAKKDDAKDAKKTHIQVFTGKGAAFDGAKKVRLNDFQDGTSNTILVALAKTPVDWTKPDDIAFDPNADPRKLLLRVTRAGKPNDAAGYRFARADGSVGGFDADVDEDEVKTMITRSAGDLYEKKKK